MMHDRIRIEQLQPRESRAAFGGALNDEMTSSRRYNDAKLSPQEMWQVAGL